MSRYSHSIRLMLPPDVGIHQRQRWSLEELIAHWARQGASQSDMLYLAWKLLNRADRPEGLKIEMGLRPGDNTARGSADIPTNGIGELSSLKILEKMGVERPDIVRRLWLERSLAEWLCARLNAGKLNLEAKLITELEVADKPFVDEAIRLIKESGNTLPVKTAVRRAIENLGKNGLEVSGSKTGDSTEQRIAGRVRKEMNDVRTD